MMVRLSFEIREDGLYANEESTFIETMYNPDMRTPQFVNSPRVFRRDMLKKHLDQYNISIPRGANIGTTWDVFVDMEVCAWWDGDGEIIDCVADLSNKIYYNGIPNGYTVGIGFSEIQVDIFGGVNRQLEKVVTWEIGD